jgi:hypothetical protein
MNNGDPIRCLEEEHVVEPGHGGDPIRIFGLRHRIPAKILGWQGDRKCLFMILHS